jgi:hypothetical protein
VGELDNRGFFEQLTPPPPPPPLPEIPPIYVWCSGCGRTSAECSCRRETLICVVLFLLVAVTIFTTWVQGCAPNGP